MYGGLETVDFFDEGQLDIERIFRSVQVQLHVYIHVFRYHLKLYEL